MKYILLVMMATILGGCATSSSIKNGRQPSDDSSKKQMNLVSAAAVFVSKSKTAVTVGYSACLSDNFTGQIIPNTKITVFDYTESNFIRLQSDASGCIHWNSELKPNGHGLHAKIFQVSKTSDTKEYIHFGLTLSDEPWPGGRLHTDILVSK